MDTLSEQLKQLHLRIEKLNQTFPDMLNRSLNQEANEPSLVKTIQAEAQDEHHATLKLNGQDFQLNAEQVTELISQLSLTRPRLQPPVSTDLLPGMPFVSTKNPHFVVQKQNNGDRLVFFRHTGLGWVPITFSPENVIALYMLLSQS